MAAFFPVELAGKDTAPQLSPVPLFCLPGFRSVRSDS